MNKEKREKHNVHFDINNEGSNDSESTDKNLINSGSDNENSVDIESDNADIMEDTNDYEDKEDNHEIESLALKQEKKRKKVTDDLTEVAVKKKRKFENSLYKQPTVEELNQLKETQNLFHSNLFRLQIEEVLNEVKIKNKYVALYNDWFKKLKVAIESIVETEEVSVSNNLHICNIIQ